MQSLHNHYYLLLTGPQHFLHALSFLHSRHSRYTPHYILYSQKLPYSNYFSTMSRANSAFWSNEDKRILVEYLFDHRSAIGEGGNWTKTTLSGAAAHLTSVVTPEKGGPKTLSAVRTQ